MSQEQKMVDLPADRLSEAPPFTYRAVGMFGSFVIKEGIKELTVNVMDAGLRVLPVVQYILR